jgi:2,3-dihydroxybenzoate-AMP ligase
MPGVVGWPTDVAQRYRREGYWRGETLGSLLREYAGRHGARIALVADGRRWSYGELDTRADEVAAGLLQLGLRAGDRVLLQLPNTAEFAYVSIALFRAGIVPVYALPGHRLAELSYLAEVAEARAYIAPDVFQRFDYRPLAAQLRAKCPAMQHLIIAGQPDGLIALGDLKAPPAVLASPQPSDVAFFLLSGGTTGRPKLIPRTHDDYAYQLRACAEAMNLDEKAVYLVALPAAHNAALGCPGVLGTLWVGGRVIMSPTPGPDDVFPLVKQERPTMTTVMPPVLGLWIELAAIHDVDLTGMTLIVGGAPLRPELAMRVIDLGCTMTHWFGMAEGVLAYTRLTDPPDIVAHTQGRPMSPADEYRVVDSGGHDLPPGEVGELLARGPMTLRGYYRADEYNARAFTPDGYLRTGDLVRMTPAGNLVVEGRIKDVINRGGEKIGAEELEEYIESHPAVRSAAVVAVPDETLGEKIHAFIVQAGPIDLSGLRAFLTEQGIAGFKLPDRLETVPSLPQTTVGKIDKKQLRASAISGLAPSAETV